jgi:hypothetical protein
VAVVQQPVVVAQQPLVAAWQQPVAALQQPAVARLRGQSVVVVEHQCSGGAVVPAFFHSPVFSLILFPPEAYCLQEPSELLGGIGTVGAVSEFDEAGITNHRLDFGWTLLGHLVSS